MTKYYTSTILNESNLIKEKASGSNKIKQLVDDNEVNSHKNLSITTSSKTISGNAGWIDKARVLSKSEFLLKLKEI